MQGKPERLVADYNLAGAYARAGDYAAAIAAAQKALTLARATGQVRLAQQIQGYLQQYKSSNDSN